VKVEFRSRASVSNERRAINAQQNRALGLPVHTGAGRLAVIGGGPSINQHIEELRAFDGQIWAVNGTIDWCIKHGIDAAFYTIDALAFRGWTYPLTGIKRAVISIECDPTLFAHLSGAQIETLERDEVGPTSAAGASALGITAGYRDIVFYGCESNFGEQSHAYSSPDVPDWILIDVGGKQFRTKPEFADQARLISKVINVAPHIYSDRSGGLLAAMIQHGEDYDVIEMADRLWGGRKPVAA
jgi:hypothetical protein